MVHLVADIAKTTGSHAECIEIDWGAFSSIIGNFYNQAVEACELIKVNSNFNNTEFNIVGLSQGGLIARYVA